MKMKKAHKIIFCLSLTAFLCTVGYSSFLANKYSAESSLKKDTTAKAIAYNKNTGKLYSTLKAAMNQATSGQSVYVYSGLSIDCTDSFTIKSGVSLYLPIDENETINPAIGEASTGAPPDSNASRVNTYRKLLLNMRNGASITIQNGGNLYIGGEYYTRGNSGKYAEINLGKNSHIDCAGNLYCYGYIKENSADAVNSDADGTDIYSNSADAYRYVNFSSTGKLVSAFGIHDGNSGGRLKALLDAGVCPITSFNVSSIQTYYNFEYGATFEAIARISAVGQNVEQLCSIILPSSNSGNSIFKIDSGGSIAFEYIPKNVLYTTLGSSSASVANGVDYTKIIFSGSSSIDKVYLNISSVGTIDTSTNFLPISYNFDVLLSSSANVTMPNKIKFLPGSALKIDTGGKLNVQNDLIFYKSDSMSIVSSDDGINYPSDAGESLLLNNGNITLSSNAKLGAYVKHSTNQQGDARATLNVVNVAPTGLSVTAQEGTTLKEVNIASTADFYITDDNIISEEQFPTGQTLYSNYNDLGYYWDGEYSNTATISIKVQDLGYTYNVFEYSLYQADNASGSGNTQVGSTKIGPDVPASEDVFMVEKGNYLNLQVSRAAGTTIENSSLSYSSSTWYEVNENMTFVITPNEGKQVKITTSGNSGAGHVEYVVYESQSLTSTSSSGWYQIANTETGSITTYVIKNRKFYFTTSSSYGYYFTDKSYSIDGVDSGDHGSVSGTTATQRGDRLVYTATGNYHFDFKWHFETCITGDTLMLMSDYTYKEVRNLNIGDEILCFNHETGEITKNVIMSNIHLGQSDIKSKMVFELYFDNGRQLDIVMEHGIFDLTLNKYVMINNDTCFDYVDHDFAYYDVDSKKMVTTKLIKVQKVDKEIDVYSPVTLYHLNHFANNFLAFPGDLPGFYNQFEFKDFKYEEEAMKEDIEKYGLLSYEELCKEVELPYEVYLAFPLKYYKIAIAKGLTTFDELRRIVKAYLPEFLSKYNLNNKS